MIEANFAKILPLLTSHKVKYILIGAGAGLAHGLARSTYDVDVVYARDEDNIRHLVEALRDKSPYLRDAPPGLPFTWNIATVRSGLNFTLTTSIGNLDLFGEVTGGGTYGRLASAHGRIRTIRHALQNRLPRTTDPTEACSRPPEGFGNDCRTSGIARRAARVGERKVITPKMRRFTPFCLQSYPNSRKYKSSSKSTGSKCFRNSANARRPCCGPAW